MSVIAIVTNIPAPYRVDLFCYMQTRVREHVFHVIYTGRREDNRQWTVAEERLLNTHFLRSRVLRRDTGMDSRYIHLPAGLLRKLSALQPDAVIAFEYGPASLQALLWCRMHGRRFLHLTDGTLYSERGVGAAQKLSRALITRCADACIASSTRAEEKLLWWGVPKERIFRSLLTTDVRRFQNISVEAVPGRILYVGSMVKRKGLDLLIEALPYVKGDWHLHIVGNGTGEQEAALQRLAEKRQVAGRIVRRGFLEGEALLREYAEAKVFVLPTREDCFGLVLLEALCAGRPVVSSKYADGAYDVIEDGVNGLIEDPYDPQAFGRAITRALADETLAENARNFSAEKFSFEQVTAGYLDAIRHAEKTGRKTGRRRGTAD